MITEVQDPFWKDDIYILFNRHRLVEFVPSADMTTNERLNAITRFLIYLGILLTLVYKSSTPIYIPIVGCVLMWIVHEHYPQLGGSVAEQVQMPSAENPFMNVLLSDYVNNPQRGPAADVELPVVQKSMEENFSQGLYRDINNIWDRNNSQRQYYTMPSTTIPNDRDSFMKWCYKTPNTCKDGNLARCLRPPLPEHGNV
jgi:hypothetical protein